MPMNHLPAQDVRRLWGEPALTSECPERLIDIGMIALCPDQIGWKRYSASLS